MFALERAMDLETAKNKNCTLKEKLFFQGAVNFVLASMFLDDRRAWGTTLPVTQSGKDQLVPSPPSRPEIGAYLATFPKGSTSR